MKKRNEVGLFNLNSLARQSKKAGVQVKITKAFNAAVKASGYHLESLKREGSLEARVFRQIFYYHCAENKLCSYAKAASFFGQDRVTGYRSWQLIKNMIDTRDASYLSAIEKFEHSLSMIELNYEKLILAIKFDAFSMSDSAFLEKYSNLLF